MQPKTWNRWHTDGWVLTVARDADGQFTFSVAERDVMKADRQPAKSLSDAQHQAETIVRASTHRCSGPCSYWVADGDEDA